jgi:hypothetical protein
METEIKSTDPFFKFILKILGVLAGISSSISILFTAAGFLLLKGHENLLGIAGLVQHSLDDYLYEGGLFFINTIADIFSYLTNWWVVAVIVVFFLLSLAIKKAVKADSLKKCIGWFRSWKKTQLIVYTVVMFVALYMLIGTIGDNDILFNLHKNSAALVNRSDQSHLAVLHQVYALNILLATLSCACTVCVFRILPEAKGRGFLQTLFLYFIYCMLVLIVLLLPISYGKLEFGNDFYKVKNIILSKDEEGKIADSDDLWLIDVGANQVLLFSKDENIIEVISSGKVVNLTLDQRANLFEKK